MADPDKTLVKFAAVDKYTATFTYSKPKPMFIYNMTRGGNGNVPTASSQPVTPSHYMKQFHEDLTTDKAALDADVKKRGFADWQTYYLQFARSWTANPDKPVTWCVGCQERPHPRSVSDGAQSLLLGGRRARQSTPLH